MKQIISTRYLKQTKLVKKADYEDIVNIVEPEVRVHVPKRKANEQYSSHFNLVYSNLSDDRIKDMEKQLLLEKFSKHYGFNLARVRAFTEGNGLTPVSEAAFRSAHSSHAGDSDDEMGGGGGGGGGGGFARWRRVRRRLSRP